MTANALTVRTVLRNSWCCSRRATFAVWLMAMGMSFPLAAGEPAERAETLAVEEGIVLVQLRDGRVLRTGRVELLPASRELELLSTARGIRIWRRVPLELVAAVTAGGRTLRFDEERATVIGSSRRERRLPDLSGDLTEEPVDAGAVVSTEVTARRDAATVAAAAGGEVTRTAFRPTGPGVVGEPGQHPVPLPRRSGPAVLQGYPAGGGSWHDGTFSGSGSGFPGPGPGRVIGVRPGPLTAYADLAAVLYPFGVPAVETAAALDLLRAARARQVFDGAAGVPVPPLWPGAGPGWREPAGAGPQPLLQPAPAPAPIPVPEARVPATGELRLLATAGPVVTRGGNEIDSLEVVARLVDGRGVDVPFSGTLSMRLHGLEVRPVRGFGETAELVPQRERLLATRTAMIRGTARGTAGVARLPLTDTLPAHDSSVAPAGDLHLELTVPGRGVYATTVAEIPLAGTSRLQQWRLFTAGSRFAADQRNSGGRLQAGAVYRGRFVRGSTLVPAGSLGPPGRVFTVQP